MIFWYSGKAVDPWNNELPELFKVSDLKKKLNI